MDGVALFADAAAGARPLKPRPFASEANLRRFTEGRLNSALGLTFAATEVPVAGWATGTTETGSTLLISMRWYARPSQRWPSTQNRANGLRSGSGWPTPVSLTDAGAV